MQTNSALEKKNTAELRPATLPSNGWTRPQSSPNTETTNEITRNQKKNTKNEKRRTTNTKNSQNEPKKNHKNSQNEIQGQANTKHNDPLLRNPRSPPMPELKPLKSMNFAAHFVDDFCGLPFPPKKKAMLNLVTLVT